MWDKPAALQRLTGWIVAVTVLFTLWVAGRAVLEQLFPLRQVTVIGAEQRATEAAVRELTPRLVGGFFSMDLNAAHAAFEALPWVRHAEVRRLWPGRLVVTLEEHVPAASWNDRAILNTHGEIFQVTPWEGLPRLYAPEGMEKEVARRYGEFVAQAARIDLRVEQVVMSARQSWRIRLSGGINVELGRERIQERLERFVRYYPLAVAAVGPLRRIDMRYPNGFAGEIRAPTPSSTDARRSEPGPSNRALHAQPRASLV